jgi:chorismate-pyruvate lyase
MAALERVLILDLDVGASILERRVLLRGARTSTIVLYADSLIALDRLDARIRHGLLTAEQPIGRLIRDHRVETFRELLSYERTCNGQVAALFGLQPETPLLTRTYRMSNGGKPVMRITERFPC